MKAPALLAILDGVGIAPDCPTNAVTRADAPFLHELFSDTTWPCRTLNASGRDVGLPTGQMGNSEVGHLNIGAGRVINQELTRIDRAIEEGELAANEVLLDAFDAAIAADGAVHFFGLHSDGGVHSSLNHLYALVEMAAARGVRRIRIAAFLDGRDVSPVSGVEFVRQTQAFCRQIEGRFAGVDARLSMISGRYWAMDRDKRWDRVERAWRALVLPGEADVTQVAADADGAQIVQDSYDAGITDEFVDPVALGSDGIHDKDSIVFFNFRPDRAREITQAFIDPGFEGFERPVVPQVTFVCMTEYDAGFEKDFGVGVAFDKSFPKNVLADYLASRGLAQLHIAETEKYAHVTFFFNGGVEEPKKGEQRILIPSPKVATYDLQPEMSAPEVTDALVDAIEKDAAAVYIVNFANGDMVGHTGVLPAAIAAVEVLDVCLKRVVDAVLAKGGVALVTADHGNSEIMVAEDGEPWTAHTLSPVPFVLLEPEPHTANLEREGAASLADIAPTLLDLMELDIPQEFTGRSLLVRS